MAPGRSGRREHSLRERTHTGITASRTLRKLVGANVAAIRDAGSLTQTEVAQRVGDILGTPWARQQISRAETGGRALNVDELVALAVALDVTVIDLLAPRPDENYRLGERGSLDAGTLQDALLRSDGSAASAHTALGALRDAMASHTAAETRMRHAAETLVRLVTSEPSR